MHTFKRLLIFCLATPFAFLPLRWSQGIGHYLGLLLIRCNKKRQHIALTNFSVCFPDETTKEHQQRLRATAIEAGKWFMESAYVWFRNPSFLSSKVNITNPELLQSAHDKGNGVVVVLPHQGNWEMLNFCIPQHYPFGAMYRPINSPLFEKIIFDSRSRVGTKMFAANKLGVRKALKALKNNHVVAVLSDHLPSEDAGVYAPFFGRPALTGKLTHTLARYNASEVLIATVIRLPYGKGYEVCFSSIEGIDTKNAIEAAGALNQAIEKSIMLAPEQYQWVYRRFAKPPKGVADIY
ncbi:lysophospholipid acyltransferase family protein [Eionea flava]